MPVRGTWGQHLQPGEGIADRKAYPRPEYVSMSEKQSLPSVMGEFSAITLPQVAGWSPGHLRNGACWDSVLLPPLSLQIGFLSLGVSFHNRHQSSLICSANLLSYVTLFPYQKRKKKVKSLINQLVHCPFFSVFLFSISFLTQVFICALKDNPPN